MFEYIRRVSVAVSFITDKVNSEETHLRENLKTVSLELLLLAQKFRHDYYKVEDLKKLEEEIVYLVDLVDFAKINNYISVMNANIFIDSQIAFLKHISNLIEQKNTYLEPFIQLKELDEYMVRKHGKELAQTKFSLGVISENSGFTNLPNKKSGEVATYENLTVAEKNIANKFDIKKEVTEQAAPKKILEEKIITPQNNSQSISSNISSPENVEKEIKLRRAGILAALTGGGGSIKEIGDKLKGVNEKTLQRDLLELMRDKKVIMLGKKRWAKYYLK